MPEFSIKVLGSEGCDPCKNLKRDVEMISKVFDVDFEYIDVGKVPVSDISEEMKDLVRKYAEDDSLNVAGVPIISVKSKCGSDSAMGYGQMEELWEMMAGIRCRGDEK